MAEPGEMLTRAAGTMKDEAREDYLDYCAAAEAIDEALETGEITPLDDFIKELGHTAFETF